MPSADFRCPGCNSTTTLHWPSGQKPPADEGCEFCKAIEPLRRDWSPVGVGPGTSGSTPPRTTTRRR